MIKEGIEKLLAGSSLEEVEIREIFDEINSGLANDVDVSSFVTAFSMSKDLNEDSLCSMITSSRDSIKKINFGINNEEIIENTFFDFDDNFLNIPFCVDLVCASANLPTARYCFNDLFSYNNSFLIAKKFEIPYLYSSEDNSDFFEKNCFGYVLLSEQNPYLKYTRDISTKMKFDNVFKIIDKMLNPYCAKNQLIGLKKIDFVEKFARLCLLLKNTNSIVISGESVPFVNLSGKTLVAEAWKNKIFTYNLSADLFGLKNSPLDVLKVENLEHNVEIIQNLVNGKIKNGIYDYVVANSGLALYISKKADSFMSGIDLAKRLIDNGIVMEKLALLSYKNQ